MRHRLYQWHLRLVVALLSLTPEQALNLEAWEQVNPAKGAYEWPGWAQIIVPRPQPKPLLLFSREKSA